jgi:hypothetical protein
MRNKHRRDNKRMGFINIFSHRLRPWDLVYWTICLLRDFNNPDKNKKGHPKAAFL